MKYFHGSSVTAFGIGHSDMLFGQDYGCLSMPVLLEKATLKGVKKHFSQTTKIVNITLSCTLVISFD